MKKIYMFAVLLLAFAAGCESNDTDQTQTAKIVKTQSVAQVINSPLILEGS